MDIYAWSDHDHIVADLSEDISAVLITQFSVSALDSSRPPKRWIDTVAASGRQCSQVISRSLRSWGRSSGANASAVKEPGHFAVRKSSSQVTGFFSRHPQNTGCQRRWLFQCQKKTNKAVRHGKLVTFFFKFSVHTITEAKQKAGRSQGGGIHLV